MKKLLLLACLVVALVPRAARAEDDDDKDEKPHIRATEIAGAGLGAAALAGIAGYLILRRRHTS